MAMINPYIIHKGSIYGCTMIELMRYELDFIDKGSPSTLGFELLLYFTFILELVEP